MRQTISSVLAPVLAFIASQHHMIHMLMIGAGIGGGVGTALMSGFPWIRRGMLLVSLVMAVIMLRPVLARKGPHMMRTLNGISAVLTLGLVVWSVITFGL